VTQPDISRTRLTLLHRPPAPRRRATGDGTPGGYVEHRNLALVPEQDHESLHESGHEPGEEPAVTAAAVVVEEDDHTRARREADERLIELADLNKDDPRYPALRQAAVEGHLPLVHHLAQRFRGRGEPYDDLVQVGTIGLLHAVDRYDPERGSFAAFAVPTIVGEIRRHFRDRGWAMRIPRRVQDLGRRVNQARESLTHELDRSPTIAEIASRLEVDQDLVVEALETAGAYVTVPLPTSADESDRLTKAFEDAGLELVEQREMLRPLLARLPARQQRILELRFARGMSQSQIAGEVGVSQMHVSRLLAKSLSALRSGLSEEH
jgi:RNA polymerase sigma-B factor